MKTIKSLDKTSFESLFIAFNEAFSNYEIQINKEELRIMLKRRGFMPKLSFGAFEDEKLIAFTLNGIGLFNGVKTAYDTGTGTIKEYRGQGIASDIFTHSLPFLKDAGISQYLLEVLQHNTNAVSVYKKLGFNISREFNYYTQNSKQVKPYSKNLPAGCYFKEIDLDHKEQLMQFWDFTPSWQNNFEAIMRKITDFKTIGLYKDNTPIGYCIFEPTSGDVTQIAVDKPHRRQGIASALLNEMLKHSECSSIKVVNTEISCNAMTAFLESNGIPLKGKQFEMIKKL